jgi:hypothetical protein
VLCELAEAAANTHSRDWVAVVEMGWSSRAKKQAVRRAMKRLAEEGCVERSTGGYTSTDSLAVRLGEHSSRVPCQPPGGTRRPNRLVESRVEPLVRTR